MTYKKLILIAFFVIIGLSSASFASAANSVYYSVGQNTTSHETGAGNVTVSGTTATFTVAQTATNMGVGDVINYDTDNKLCYISAKTSSTVWSCTSATGTAPTEATGVVVNSVSHVFASLSAAEAGAPTLLGNSSLTAIDVQLNFPCYYDTGADTTAVTIDGYTTDVTRYIKIYTPNNISTEANQSQRHSGKWDEGKYKLVSSLSANGAILLNKVAFTVINGLQVDYTFTGALTYVYGIRFEEGTISGEIHNVSNCIVKGTASAGSTTYAGGIHSKFNTVNVYNNIIYNSPGGVYRMGIVLESGMVFAYNNTVYGIIGGTYAYGFYVIADTFNAKNNIAYNNTTDYSGTFNSGSTNNLSKDGTAPPFNTYYINKTLTFTNTTSGSEDFHLSATDTDARGAGANLTADTGLPFSTDIDGQLRNPVGTGWDIGADEGTVEFTPTVMQTGGDYSTLSSWESGVQTDLVATTTRVFPHGGITGTIADNATVTGLTSGATATVVHATTTQILLENISGIFASGETIQVTAGNSVVISDNGNPASAVAKIDGAWTTADTTAVTVDGWTTGADNYIKIYTTPTARHQGKWDDGRYRLSVNGTAFSVNNKYTIINGLQISNIAVGYVSTVVLSADNEFFSNNIVKANTNSTCVKSFGDYLEIYNNIVYNGDSGFYISYTGERNRVDLYNNTVYNSSGTGIYNGFWTGLFVKNNISINNGIDDYRPTSYSALSSNNISQDATAPGTNSKINTTVSFIDATNSDFHLSQTDTAAKNSGIDLSVDANLAFTNDIDGNTRNALINVWDIGADEAVTQIFRSVGPSATTVLESDTAHARTITLTSGVATFSTGLATNIGVGDAVLIDTGGTDQTIDSADTILFIHARTDSTHYTLQTHTGATPANITINDTYQIYRAYTSLSLAEAGTANSTLSGLGFTFNGGDRDLVINNEQWNIAAYANGTTEDTTAVGIGGWTTSAQNYLKVYTPVTSSEVGVSQRHQGKWDDGKYQLKTSSAWSEIFSVYEEYIVIDGLQIQNTTSFAGSWNINFAPTSSGRITISNSIIKNSGHSTRGAININQSGGIQELFIYNNIIQNNFGYGIYFQSSNGSYTGKIANNTFIGNNYGIYATGYNFGGIDIHNNISVNNTVADYVISNSVPNYANNLSSDATATGTGAKINQIVQFVDATNKDFHLAPTDTSARDAGVNLARDASLAFMTDIDGDQRSQDANDWDIGADEMFAYTSNVSSLGTTTMSMSLTDKMTNGLVGMWSFDGPDIAGTTAYDRSSLGNNGTITGAVPVIGKRGQALNFDGVNSDNVAAGDPVDGSLDFNASQDFSLSAWFKTTQANGGIIGKENGSVGYRLYFTGGYLYTRVFDGTNDMYSVYTLGYNNGEWHHVVMNADRDANLSLYVDGVMKNSANMSAIGNLSNSSPMFIGINISGSYEFNGNLDEVRVYNRVLSAEEIGDLYKLGSVELRR